MVEKGVLCINTAQIAKLAQVSRSTVSRVLNNYSNVPEKTREKVQAVIDEYGYTPNHFARSLVGMDSTIVGIFIADINDTDSPQEWVGMNSPYNMELLSNLIDGLKAHGYMALVNIISDPREFDQLVQLFESRMICGGIFTGFPYQTAVLSEIAMKYNAVFIDQFSASDAATAPMKTVNCDNYFGGYQATKYLIDHGHRHILHIEGDDRLSSLERKKGYLQAMHDCGNLSPHVVQGLYKEDVAFRETVRYLEIHQPTAIFAANDIMSLGAIRAIQAEGCLVGEDISVIGFDHLKVASWHNLNLTTFELSLKQVAQDCVSLLLSKERAQILKRPVLVPKHTVKKI